MVLLHDGPTLFCLFQLAFFWLLIGVISPKGKWARTEQTEKNTHYFCIHKFYQNLNYVFQPHVLSVMI